MKKVREIFLTPENVMDWQLEYHSYKGKECLSKHLELDNMLAEITNNRTQDWGGKYADFISSLGLVFQTEFGYWNKTAVDIDNLQTFIDYYYCQDEDLVNEIDNLKEILKKIPNQLKRKSEDYIKITDLLKYGNL